MTRADRTRVALFAAAVALVGAAHVRAARRTLEGRADPAIDAPIESVGVEIVPIDGARIGVVLRIVHPSVQRSRTQAEEARLVFGDAPRVLAGPWVTDGFDRPVAAQIDRRGARWPLPTGDHERDRTVHVAFETDRPKETFGWGHRATLLPWVTTLAPRGTPLEVEGQVEGTTTAPGWRCTAIANRASEAPVPVCTNEPRHRRPLAVPIGPSRGLGGKLLFALVIGTAISLLMWAIWRAWSALATRMGDDPRAPVPALEEWIDQVRRAREPRAQDDLDPLDAVALVARGIVAVLGVIGSAFLVAHFEGGAFPILGEFALSAWATVAAVIVVSAVGIDRPRPWLSALLIVIVGAAALLPVLRWMAIGLPPVLAAVLMQLTATRSGERVR